MTENREAAVRGRRRARVILVVVFALFAAPLVTAWLVLNLGDGWVPAGAAAHGELIQPPRAVSAAGLTNLEGAPLGEDFFAGRWTLTYAAGTGCGEACRGNLYKLRQVRLAQGKNIDRVQRLVVLTTPRVPAALAGMLAQYPGLRAARAEAGFLAALGVAQGARERIYLIDPLGNLMMRYEAGAEARGMVKDLERLLRISPVREAAG